MVLVITEEIEPGLDAPRLEAGDPTVPTLSPKAFNTRDAAALCGSSASHFAKLRQRGDKRRPGLPEGPRFRRIGRKVIYLRADLDLWLASLTEDTAATSPIPGKEG